jgi:hypothetical protein
MIYYIIPQIKHPNYDLHACHVRNFEFHEFKIFEIFFQETTITIRSFSNAGEAMTEVRK